MGLAAVLHILVFVREGLVFVLQDGRPVCIHHEVEKS
jgi:hypothetical protein